MTDIVFLLLIFFMVSTQFINFQRRLNINLPESKAGTVSVKKKEYVIEITRNKEIYLNGKKIDLTTLEALIKSEKNIAERSALIRADKNLPYGFVIKVLGILKANNINDIGIAVIK
ncbi:MAG: biopolymer transporter ExbD [Deferribacteres bacterium]|nr:biopolymer transporter ExbD [Deferribacteres bacterium]